MTVAPRRIRGTTVACAVLLLAVAGCAQSVTGSGSGSPAATTPSSSPSFPSSAPSSPPAFSSSAAGPTSAPTSVPPLSTSDITDIHYSVPAGFVKSTAYHPVQPFSRSYKSAYLVPRNEQRGLDVLSITLYTLPASAQVRTIAAAKASVAAYDRRTKTRVVSGPRLTIVGGRAAVGEYDFEAPNYKFWSWYVFGGSHLALLACQYDKQLKHIVAGCASLLRSIRLT